MTPAQRWLWAALALGPIACLDNPYPIGKLKAPDAGTVTAPAPDAGGDDRASDSGAPDGGQPPDPCRSHVGALACSGFEWQDLRDWPAPITRGQAQVAQSNARARSGNGSLHAISRGADSTAVLAQDFEPQRDGTLHLRLWLFVPAGLVTRTMNLLFLGDDPNPSSEPAAPFLGLDVNLEGGALQLYSPQNAPDRVTSDSLIPRDRWFCLRVELQVGDAGAARLFVDDSLALEAAPHDTLPDAGLHQLRVGIDWSSGQVEPFEVFMDDLVLSDQPVACSDP